MVALFKLKHIEISLSVRHQKMGFANRMKIPAANGVTTLSVPLVGGRENRLPVGMVRIDNTQQWQVRHWRTLTSAYNRSPWFEYLEPVLRKFYERRYDLLWEWNRDLLGWTSGVLGLEANIEYVGQWSAAVAGGSALAVVPSLAGKRGRQTEGLPVYRQVFQDRIGFQPDMSILDLLCNEGPAGSAELLFCCK